MNEKRPRPESTLTPTNVLTGMEMACLTGATDWFWNMPSKIKTVQLCNNHLPGFLNKFTNDSAARAHSPLVQYLPYLKDASAKATATGQRRQYSNPRGKHVRGETSPSTEPWMQVPAWSQQAESLASARLGLHRVKSCYPFISLEITAAFHSKLAWKR